MKITWFGGSTFRIYVGGRILVTDADKAPAGTDPHEVAAAADYRIDITDGVADFPFLDIDNWQPRKQARLIDIPEEEIFELYTVSGEGLLVDEPAEGPVIVAPAADTAWGHFADDAVVVLFGDPAAVLAGIGSLVAAARPRLVAIAAPPFSDSEIASLSAACGTCPAQLMEPGMALEA